VRNAIYILFGYHFIVRTATNYLQHNDVLGIYYGDFCYFMDALMIIGIAFFVYMKSEHSYRHIAALTGICLLGACQMINTGVQMYTSDESKFIEYLPELMTVVIVLDIGSMGVSKLYNKMIK